MNESDSVWLCRSDMVGYGYGRVHCSLGMNKIMYTLSAVINTNSKCTSLFYLFTNDTHNDRVDFDTVDKFNITLESKSSTQETQIPLK